MADAKRDNNFVTTIMGVSIADLETPELVAVDNTNNRLMVSSVITGAGGGNALGIPEHDNGTVAYPDDTTETYTFKSGATTVATVTITYTDNTKASMSTWSIA